MAEIFGTKKAYETQDATVPTATHMIRRISWASIFAGVVIALVVELVLSLLGIGIGASTVDPLQDANPMKGIGIGAGIWFLMSTLIALFAAGWTAARLAGIPYLVDSILHGVITWGMATLLLFYLLSSAAGSVFGGAFGLLGQGASLLGKGAAAATPAIRDAVKGQLDDRGIDWSDLTSQAEVLLRQSGKPELNPSNIKRETKQVSRDAQSTANDAAKSPENADEGLTALWNRISQKGSDTFAAADREALINVVVARTNMDRAEAGRTVDQWQETYKITRAKYEQAKKQAKQKALEIADATARNVSRAALWTFVALLFGLGAAAWGGQRGAPTDAPLRAV